MEKLLKLLDSHKVLCEREELLEGRAARFRWFGPNLSEGNLDKRKALREELEQARTNIADLEGKLEDAIAASIRESEEAVKEAQRVLDELYPIRKQYPVADMEINSESALTTSARLKNVVWENRHLDRSGEE